MPFTVATGAQGDFVDYTGQSGRHRRDAWPACARCSSSVSYAGIAHVQRPGHRRGGAGHHRQPQPSGHQPPLAGAQGTGRDHRAAGRCRPDGIRGTSRWPRRTPSTCWWSTMPQCPAHAGGRARQGGVPGHGRARRRGCARGLRAAAVRRRAAGRPAPGAERLPGRAADQEHPPRRAHPGADALRHLQDEDAPGSGGGASRGRGIRREAFQAEPPVREARGGARRYIPQTAPRPFVERSPEPSSEPLVHPRAQAEASLVEFDRRGVDGRRGRARRARAAPGARRPENPRRTGGRSPPAPFPSCWRTCTGSGPPEAFCSGATR